MRARLLLVLAYLLFALSACALLPQFAAAEASKGPEDVAGAPGLPDGRVYEMVSPANKPGSEAGPPTPYIVAGPEGNEVAFSTSGPLGETSTGLDFFSVARHTGTGWQSHGAMPRGIGDQTVATTNPQFGFSFAANLSATVFTANDTFVSEQEQGEPTPHLYLYGEDGQVQWIGKPTIAEPIKFTEAERFGQLGAFDGASSDFETVYYDFPGVLTPEGEEPNPALGDISFADEVRALNVTGNRATNEDTIYEWDEGKLTDAAILPDGHMDPWGAIPAASLLNGNVQETGHQVSEDGRTMFFLSPDPEAESGRPSQLYVRKTAADGAQSTALVSRDTLLPEAGGEPAGAPVGVKGGRPFYATPDGSHAFFESTEQLTSDAPGNGDVKEYEFDTETDTLSYLPGVADYSAEAPVEILGSSSSGSNFIYVRQGELELWNDGQIVEIAPFHGSANEGLMRATPDGEVYVFQSASPFTALHFNNGNGAYSEVYRYETAGNELSCVSCPPASTAPSGNASLSHAFGSSNLGNTLGGISPGNHGISEDGGRVFFDTPDPLVVQDTNGVRDAYEWEDGEIHLISTGVSPSESFFGDNSASGNDVFFSTSEGLAPGDADEAYDVYDARVPRPGDQGTSTAVPCEGSVCQGQPGSPQLLQAPASEVFNGAGNLSPTVTSHNAPKSLTRKQKLAKALKACTRQSKGHARKKCKRKARERYGSSTGSAHVRGKQEADGQHNGNRGHNRRGK
ncbi:MAG TPA: hypothetical protein VGF95_01490 [Solirubrobacteraceae bacterium]|jgi:hypothetical protein